jgi:diguanylate cyclase (GGDEF)-like protein/PAS domain S-box-containing protein
MTNKNIDLRRLAEDRVKLKADEIRNLTPVEAQRVLYDLRTHQIELEMQNEELRRAQLELQEAHARFVELYDYSPAGYLTINPAGTVLEANLTIAEMLGVERGLLVKQPLSQFVHESSQDAYYLCLQKQKETKTAKTMELCLHHKGDGWFWAGVECRPVLEEDGSLKEFYLIISNINERKRVEVQLRQAAAVVENTAEAVMITNSDNKIVLVNNAFTRITGYAPDEVIGKNPRILKSDRHDLEFYTNMWSTIDKNGSWQNEVWDRRKDGEIFPAWLNITRVNDENGDLANYVSVLSDISSIKQSQAELDFLAYHDPLTNLPNRLLFSDRLKQALRHARREKHNVAVLFVDLDRFKNINDSLGHAVGDKLIQLAAQRIKGVMREEDTVARLGGDEFIIAMGELHNTQDVVTVAKKLNEEFQSPFIVGEHELHVSLSIGISLYPQDGEDGETLIKNADAAMYRAKDYGRNNFHFYIEELTATVFERLTMETALRKALEQGEMEVYYQPQYAMKGGALVGIEALLRWHHPEEGLLHPSRFIALAEESGVIMELGRWVLRQACGQMQQWLQAGYSPQRISVNVSAIQLQRGTFVQTVEEVLAETGLDARYLELEITESVIMQKTDWGIKALNRLKSLGVRSAIDDFGTGYSSLSYLKTLPVSRLKIDRSFVQDIPDDVNDVAIAKAIVALGKSLQLSIIAEGVETEEQRELLSALGCDDVQGHFYHPAMPADEIGKVLAATEWST